MKHSTSTSFYLIDKLFPRKLRLLHQRSPFFFCSSLCQTLVRIDIQDLALELPLLESIPMSAHPSIISILFVRHRSRRMEEGAIVIRIVCAPFPRRKLIVPGIWIVGSRFGRDKVRRDWCRGDGWWFEGRSGDRRFRGCCSRILTQESILLVCGKIDAAYSVRKHL